MFLSHDGDRNLLNESDATGDFPWAWLRAFNDIVNAPAPPQIPNPPVAVLPWLYLAPMYCVRNHETELHQQLGITHVLSTNRMPPQVLESLYWELRSNEIDHYYVPADDQLSYNMMAHWDECREFLQQCRSFHTNKETTSRTGKALVHCSAGMNRSGTIVAAAMMHFGEMNLLQVARELKAKRGYVLNNASFVKQLVEFACKEQHLGEKPTGYSDDPIVSRDTSTVQAPIL